MHSDLYLIFKNFINLFNDEFIKDVTEINTDSFMKSEYERLIRLYEDFKFFDQKSDNKVHVILLGNFSSGKSSTINSLLNLDDKEGQQTSKQVTDTDITMLAHPNYNPQFGLRTNYGPVTIKKKIIEHPFLENIILVDTPGSGDINAILMNRHLDEFIIQSDLLLYLFNSHMSLTSDDRPVLLAKQKYFPIIEMKFVITNADYFRLSRNIMEVENNLNEGEYDNFIETLIDRIHNIPFEDGVPKLQPSPNDFVLIDNEEKYGIENLKTYIRNYSSNLTPAIKSAIREFKINSYTQRIKEIKNNFIVKVKVKYEILEKYYTQAQDNVSEYEREVFIANNEQSKTYDRHLNVISASRFELQSFLGKLYANNVDDESMWADSEIEALFNINQFNDSLREKARDYMNESISNIRKRIVPLINEFRYTVENIKVNEVDERFELNFDYSKIVFTPEQDSLLNLPDTVINKIENIAKYICKKIVDKVKVVEKDNETFNARLLKNMPVDKIEEVLQTAKRNMESDLRIHFKNVELFHFGVFSINNDEKNIKFKLNDIKDISFSEQDKHELNSYATEILFPSYEYYISEFKFTCERLRNRLENITKETEFLSPETSNWSSIYRFQPDHSSLEELKSMYNEISSKIRSVFINIKNDIEAKIVDLAIQNRHEAYKRKSGQKKLILAYILTSSILFIISYFLPKKLSDNSGTSNLFINLLSSSIWSFFTLIFGFIHSYYVLSRDKKREVDSIVKKQSEIMRQLETSLDKLYNELEIQRDGILQIYSNMISEHFKKVRLEEKFLPSLYSRLFQIKSKGRSIASDYNNHVENLCNKFKEYFTFDNFKFLKISDKIKAKSIEPPMKDLKSEVENYKSAKKTLEQIYLEE